MMRLDLRYRSPLGLAGFALVVGACGTPAPDADESGSDASTSGEPSTGPATDDPLPTSTGEEPPDTDTDPGLDPDMGTSCGDGVVDPGEACDDGNVTNGDGCQADCTITGGETDWTVDHAALPGAAAALALDDGGFVVLTEPGDPRLARFDADGQLMWEHSATFADRDARDLALSATGEVLVVGSIPIDIDFAYYELYVAGFSVEDGSHQWTAEPPVYVEGAQGNALAVDPDGGLFVGGMAGGEGGSRILLAHLDAAGAVDWSEAVISTSGEYPEAIDVVVLPDGSAVFVGKLDGARLGSMWARRVDAEGQELWTFTLGYREALDRQWSVEYGEAGLVITGTALGGDGSAIIMLGLDDDGVEQWRQTWDSPEVMDEVAQGTALGVDGTLYIAADSAVVPELGLYAAFGTDGSHAWSYPHGGGAMSPGRVRDVVVLSDDHPLFVGAVGDGAGGSHLWLRKTTP